ncbi:MAG: pilin [Candidatus Buchananbacteria bacterium]
MDSNKNNRYKTFTIGLLLSLFILIPAISHAASAPAPAPKEAGYQLNVPIGNIKSIDPEDKNILGNYIKTWYGFLVAIAGILATLMIMYAGVKWVTSRGGGAISQAKEIMLAAVTGLALVFLSYSILALINPGLLTITMPKLDDIKYSGQLELPGSIGNLTFNDDGTVISKPPSSSNSQPADSQNDPNSQVIRWLETAEFPPGYTGDSEPTLPTPPSGIGFNIELEPAQRQAFIDSWLDISQTLGTTFTPGTQPATFYAMTYSELRREFPDATILPLHLTGDELTSETMRTAVERFQNLYSAVATIRTGNVDGMPWGAFIIEKK